MLLNFDLPFTPQLTTSLQAWLYSISYRPENQDSDRQVKRTDWRMNSVRRGNPEFRMKSFVSTVRVYRTSTVLCALLCLAVALLVACGDRATPSTTPPINSVDLAVTGQTVTKVRTAGNEVVVLEERLNSIFEDGPQRTLATLQSDGRTVHPYMPPPGWSVVDFAVHPSGDISAILTTATEVRIVRLDPNGSIRSDQLFLDPSSPTDPFFNYAGGIKNDNALQPALMHDAARLAPLGESLAVVLRTGRNAIVAYRLDPDASGAYRRSWRTLVEPGSSILGGGHHQWQLRHVRPARESSEDLCGCGFGCSRYARRRCRQCPACSTSPSVRTQSISANPLQHRQVSCSRVWRSPTAAASEAL